MFKISEEFKKALQYEKINYGLGKIFAIYVTDNVSVRKKTLKKNVQK